MSFEEVFVFPVSFAQQRLWFLEQLNPGNTIYNVPTAIRLTGSLNLTALEQTFNEILRRHEVFRTKFTVVDGQPLQAIVPSLTILLPVLDLKQLPVDQREAEAKRIISAEIERPFDLSSLGLLRVMLFALSQTEHILLLNMHHIICDDWSMGLLIGELSVIYTAFAQNQSSVRHSTQTPLPELPLQYADFAHWQRQWLQGEILQTQLAYWRSQLNGISMLDLPVDKKRTNIQNYQGAIEFIELPPQLTHALEALSQQENATLFMTLLAAFQILLYRYTNQDDIAVGSPIANRNRSEIEGLIGFFVNNLVLRTNLSGNPTFKELLSRVRDVTLEAYKHQDLPFEKLVEELHPERNLSHHPLFQVVFGFQNAPMSALKLPDLIPSFINIDLHKTRFDLELHLWKCSQDFRSLWGGDWEFSEGVRGVIVYNTDLFDKSTITQLLRHFKTLLSSIVKNPQQSITNLQLLNHDQQNQILVQWNNTQTDYPKNKCIHQLFQEQVEQHPHAVALVFGIEQITYQELDKLSNQLAKYLQKLQVKSEVIVGICLEQSIDFIVGLLAILKAGGAYLPLDSSYPQERLNFMLEDAQVSILITQEKLLNNFDNSLNQTICIDKDWKIISQESQESLNSNVNSDNLAYVIYTSGSTGKPKGVAVTHKAINRLVCNTNYINLELTDKIAQGSNISFDAATFEIWGALLNGAQLVGISKDVMLSPQELALQLKEKGISVLFLTTALFQQIARDVPQAFANLKYLLFGGETIDSRWVKKVIKYGSPKRLVHVYGPTENTTFSSYYQVIEVPELATSIPIGTPITNTQIYILDANLKPVPTGVVGELYIGGEGLAREYLNRPDLTDEHFITIPETGFISKVRLYKTGDLARYLMDGNIEFLGRIDNQVKIRGFRIELGEIETVLSQHPAVQQAVVIAVEDIPGEKQLVGYIVSHQAQIPKSIDLQQFLKVKLPDYMIPRVYVVLESLPLSPNGKVNRRALPMPDTFIFNQQDYVAPSTHVEVLLAEIWAKILGKEQVGIHDNFFELGGHSLLATQLVSRIRDTLRIDVSVRNLFEAPTVEQLARYIEAMSWATQGLHNTSNKEMEREEVEF
jgi:amino acid adenylation domain-containing protein